MCCFKGVSLLRFGENNDLFVVVVVVVFIVWMRLVFTCVTGCCVTSTVLLVPQTFRRALTASVDRCAEIKECPSEGVRNQFWQSLGLEEGVGDRCWECVLRVTTHPSDCAHRS